MRLVPFTAYNTFSEGPEGAVWVNPDKVLTVLSYGTNSGGWTRLRLSGGLGEQNGEIQDVAEHVEEVVARLTADPARAAELRAEYERLKAEADHAGRVFGNLDNWLNGPNRPQSVSEADKERAWAAEERADAAYAALQAFLTARPEVKQPATVRGERAEGGG